MYNYIHVYEILYKINTKQNKISTFVNVISRQDISCLMFLDFSYSQQLAIATTIIIKRSSFMIHYLAVAVFVGILINKNKATNKLFCAINWSQRK